jgi:hypothetical protein
VRRGYRRNHMLADLPQLLPLLRRERFQTMGGSVAAGVVQTETARITGKKSWCSCSEHPS